MFAFSFVTTCLPPRECISAAAHYRPRLSLLTNGPPPREPSTLPPDIYQRARARAGLGFLRAKIIYAERRINLGIRARVRRFRTFVLGENREDARPSDATNNGSARCKNRPPPVKFPDGPRERATPRAGKFMRRRWDAHGAQLTNYYSIREIELPPPFTESAIFAVDCLSPIIGT